MLRLTLEEKYPAGNLEALGLRVEFRHRGLKLGVIRKQAIVEGTELDNTTIGSGY